MPEPPPRTAGTSSTALTAPGSRRLGRSCGISPLGYCAAWPSCHQADGDDDAAVAALQRAVDLDPYGEETARRLIVLHDHSGNPDAARRAYRRLCRVLQDDLDVAPSPRDDGPG
jgi:tetratricopeptide (TPR) repeat protein